MVGRNLPPAANREAIGVLSKVTNRIIVELDIATRTGSSQGKRRLQWQTSLCIGIFFFGWRGDGGGCGWGIYNSRKGIVNLRLSMFPKIGVTIPG